MFERILVAVDGSEHAMAAVATASNLARKYGSALYLLHVMEDVGSSRVPRDLEYLSKTEHIDVTERDVLRSVANQIVERAVAQAREAGVASPHYEVQAGHPGSVIVETAKRHDADLIVMGRRGLGRVADLMLGSVSHRVTQLAECACLTVK